MQQLNLPLYNFRIKNQNNKVLIFDTQRKKYVTLTPEEWVRQNFIHFLITELHYPAAYIAVEKQLIINGLKKRCDAIIYNNMAQPIVIVEFKAPNITINQEVFDQAAVYNSKLNIDYFQSDTEDYFECFPNPSNGVFRVNHMGNFKSENIQLHTITGQSCRFISTEFEMETVIQIINPSTGVYFARFLLDSGELIVKKIVITRV